MAATKYALPAGQKLATFKIDEEMWESFKTLCEENGTSASRTLINFIKGCLSAGKLDEIVLAPPPEQDSQNQTIDIDALEARLMARFEARLEEALAGK